DSNRIFVKSKTFQISAGEVLNLIRSLYGNRADGMKDMETQQLSTFIEQLTTELVEKKLLLQAAKKSNIKASTADIDSILNAQYTRAGGKDPFLTMLKDGGFDFEYVKKDVESSLTINAYLEEIVKRQSDITEDQIQEAYKTYLQDTVASVQHILLMTQNKSDAEKKEIRDRIENILTRARRGEEFGELAKEFSEDPGSKDTGGLYENFSRGVMVKPFEDAAFTVPVGDISGVVETQYGYHILKVVDRKMNDKPLEEVRGELEEKLRGPDRQTIIINHIEDLKKEANTEVIAFK
ncbi:MAG: peptidylprolyl isomerase, partial [bacterium]